VLAAPEQAIDNNYSSAADGHRLPIVAQRLDLRGGGRTRPVNATLADKARTRAGEKPQRIQAVNSPLTKHPASFAQ